MVPGSRLTAGRIRLSARVVPVGAFWALAGIDLWQKFDSPSGPAGLDRGYVRLSGEFHGTKFKIRVFLVGVASGFFPAGRPGREDHFICSWPHTLLCSTALTPLGALGGGSRPLWRIKTIICLKKARLGASSAKMSRSLPCASRAHNVSWGVVFWIDTPL